MSSEKIRLSSGHLNCLIKFLSVLSKVTCFLQYLNYIEIVNITPNRKMEMNVDVILNELSSSEKQYHQGLKETATFIREIQESRDVISTLGEEFQILDTTFRHYNEILMGWFWKKVFFLSQIIHWVIIFKISLFWDLFQFHNIFSEELQSKALNPEELLELFQVNKAKMKTKYALFAHTLKLSQFIINEKGEIIKKLNPNIRLSDSLTRAVRNGFKNFSYMSKKYFIILWHFSILNN